ncbi:MAG: WavE lipopolysaccharide synthesis family protein [Planctomycetia bacterium]|nr:WavE lipopolysaccharide synthesis family protein [Planctomycetia bacterium]
MISSSEISVVVQGAVAGRPSDPPAKRFTDRCLRSVRRHLPEAQIILSTWKGADVTGLSFDRLVLSDDPGAVPLDARRTPNNINRQIVSTGAGMRIVERPYAVKLRTDFELLGDRFLHYFGKFNAYGGDDRIFRERVVASTVFSINPRRFAPMPFHPSDWFFFGRSEDLRNLWDIPLAPEPETSNWCGLEDRARVPFLGGRTARYAPEQTMWLGLLRKHGDVACRHMTDVADGAIEATERTIANNLVLASPNQLGLKYLKGRRGSLWDFESIAVYTHCEWRRLYRRYCDPRATVPWIDARGYFNAYLYFWYAIGQRLLSWTRGPQADPFANSDLMASKSDR